MTIISTICWGSFANTFKGTKNYRFELYYWDYALGIFLIAVLLALTMGSYCMAAPLRFSQISAMPMVSISSMPLSADSSSISRTCC